MENFPVATTQELKWQIWDRCIIFLVWKCSNNQKEYLFLKSIMQQCYWEIWDGGMQGSCNLILHVKEDANPKVKCYFV